MTRRLFPLAVALAVVALVTLLRAPALSQAVIDWDESVYVLMGRSLLAGHAPYTAVWDHKPPGLYMLFAAALAVVGQPVLAMRVLGIVAVAAACLLLMLAGRRVLGSDLAGVAAALAYAVASTRNGGLATNAEILFAPWTMAALLLLAEPTRRGEAESPRRWLLAGLLFGVAIQIKTAAGFELLAALALLAMSARCGRRRAAAALLAGATLPTALAMLAFAAAGHWHVYFYATVTANLRYVQASPALTMAAVEAAVRQQLRTMPGLWATLAVAAALTWRSGHDAPRRHTAWLWVWLASTLLAVLASGRLFPHYFLQTLSPLALLLGWSVARIRTLSAAAIGGRRVAGRALLAGVALIAVVWPAVRPLRRAARELQAAWTTPGRIDATVYTGEYLRQRLQSGETLFVADGQPLLYELAGQESLTPYVLPALLYDPSLAAMLPVNAQQELARILRTAPSYIVTRNSAFPSTPYFTALAAALAQDYELERVIQGQRLYHHRRPPHD